MVHGMHPTRYDAASAQWTFGETGEQAVGAPLAGALKKSKSKKPWTRIKSDLRGSSKTKPEIAPFVLGFKSAFIRVQKAFDLGQLHI